MFLYMLIAIGIASIVACHYIAKYRGANPSFWGLMALIFGPLAIPFVFLSKAEKGQD